MQPPRQPAPVRHGQVRRSGGMLQRRVLSVGGQHPQWPGGEHIPQWNNGGRNLERSSGDDLDLPCGGDMRGDLLGRGQPRTPIAALAGDDLDSLSAVSYPSSDDPSGAFEQEANGNPFVNGALAKSSLRDLLAAALEIARGGAVREGQNPARGSEMPGSEDFNVGDKDAVVIVDHGSRRQESNLMLNDFVEMFRARTGYKIVEPAHMEELEELPGVVEKHPTELRRPQESFHKMQELAEPTIKDAFGKCVQQGASRVIVSPYFLSTGRHWKQDIPALAAEASKEHSNIPYIVTAPLGLHELIVDIMNDRIKYCLLQVAGDVDECTVCAGTGKCRLYS
ncbi:sirohydrochlorin ferrochelatase [Panicum miliaceum]|uniref:Sirohydrochlorin ferrochelatase n=1 Tax=Panicum miliaceum TaxID=4540 RepID=A0A3L6QC98_PANMI|nr:sirohydrochlorin ferrochelatase [Panicum miliaceum]